MKTRSVFKAFMFCLTMAMLLCFSIPVFAAGSVKMTVKTKCTTVKKTVTAGSSTVCNVEYGDIALMNDYVTFKTSKSSVATVSKKGVISAKKAGTAVITAKFGKSSAKVSLTVKAAKGSAAKTALRKKIVSYAKHFVGILPYKWAGNSLKTGTDCSGFVYLIFKKYGIHTPRSASEFQKLSNIKYKDLQAGDVVVYKNGGHVAIYIGNDKVVHAKGSDYGTVIDSMWYGKPTGYVRFIK